MPSLGNGNSSSGSYNRIVGSDVFNGRSSAGSATRIYNHLKIVKGSYYARQYLKDAVYGPFIILNKRLVWN